MPTYSEPWGNVWIYKIALDAFWEEGVDLLQEDSDEVRGQQVMKKLEYHVETGISEPSQEREEGDTTRESEQLAGNDAPEVPETPEAQKDVDDGQTREHHEECVEEGEETAAATAAEAEAENEQEEEEPIRPIRSRTQKRTSYRESSSLDLLSQATSHSTTEKVGSPTPINVASPAAAQDGPEAGLEPPINNTMQPRSKSVKHEKKQQMKQMYRRPGVRAATKNEKEAMKLYLSQP